MWTGGPLSSEGWPWGRACPVGGLGRRLRPCGPQPWATPAKVRPAAQPEQVPDHLLDAFQIPALSDDRRHLGGDPRHPLDGLDGRYPALDGQLEPVPDPPELAVEGAGVARDREPRPHPVPQEPVEDPELHLEVGLHGVPLRRLQRCQPFGLALGP